MPSSRLASQTAWALVWATGIAAVLNGAVFWARRVGLLQYETYAGPYRELIIYIGPPELFEARYLEILRFGSSFHSVAGWLWSTKLLKEIVWLAVGILLVAQLRRVRLPALLAGLYGSLAALLAINAIQALVAGAWMGVLAGARSSMFWALGAFGSRLASLEVCRRLSIAFAWVLILQAFLLPYEMHNGVTIYWMHLFETSYARGVGTFSVPVSLGAFAVVTWSMAVCWGQLSARSILLLTLMVALILVLNASATAWVAFAACLAGMAYLRLRFAHRVALLLALCPVAVAGWFALPQIATRADIHDSLWGRIYPVQVFTEQNLSRTEILFGYRLGAGTNAHVIASGHSTVRVDPTARPTGDSTPAAMYWQVGVVGVVVAYMLMFTALARDPRSRLVGIAILISSVAVNVGELFPVNIAVGLWLARAARSGDSAEESR